MAPRHPAGQQKHLLLLDLKQYISHTHTPQRAFRSLIPGLHEGHVLQEILTAALASEWTPKQELILDRTENVESVVDAVQRVALHLPQVENLPSQPLTIHKTLQHVVGAL